MKNLPKWLGMLLTLGVVSFPFSAHANEEVVLQALNLTQHPIGYISLVIFTIAYFLVIFEEQLHLHKSKPILIAAGIIWIMIAAVYQVHDLHETAGEALRHYFLEYAELFFFLLVAMTYINAMIERRVFEALRHWLVARGFSFRQLFWLTGLLAFFISPVADNLTTALIMCTVILTVGADRPHFIALSCINVVIAANAGGAFSPFGDITTLMVWQKGIIDFWDFFKLFIPSLINYVVPAAIMSHCIDTGCPEPFENNGSSDIKRGGLVIVGLFLLTIVTAVVFHNALHLPSAIGMLMGLGYLKIYGYYLRQTFMHEHVNFDRTPGAEGRGSAFDVFSHIAGSEWDTLFFFYGVILSVSGLGYMGYLSLASNIIYGDLGATTANVLVGIISAVIDNIPVMFAILSMNPDMPEVQWLLVTLTAGVGGSLLSIGSAAGVALMGQARGSYTFMSHLKWTPVIGLGYFASIVIHLWLNG